MYAARRAIGAYAQVGIETSVVDANPHRLIAMLFEGARAAINLASAAIQRGDVLAKVRAFDKAISIIGQGLQASLDHQRGGDIAVTDCRAVGDPDELRPHGELEPRADRRERQVELG